MISNKKNKKYSINSALVSRRHRSAMLKLAVLKTFPSPSTIDSDHLLSYGMKTALKRAFRSEKSQKINACSNSQNAKDKKLNT